MGEGFPATLSCHRVIAGVKWTMERESNEGDAPTLKPEKRWSVFVDDNFHYMDEGSRRARGKYATLEEAVMECMRLTRESVEEEGAGYFQFGVDPWVSPKPSVEELAALLAAHPEWPVEAFAGGYFSARTYASGMVKATRDGWTTRS